MMRWWRSHSVRVRLTLWYVAVMIVVLGVYAVGVYTFVSRSVSESLDDRLRADFFWAAATVDEGPDGLVMPAPQIDLLLEEEAPWVQVWSDDGKQLLFINSEAMRRPLPGSQKLAVSPEDAIVSFPTGGRANPSHERPQLRLSLRRGSANRHTGRQAARHGAGRPIGRGDAAAVA